MSQASFFPLIDVHDVLDISILNLSACLSLDSFSLVAIHKIRRNKWKTGAAKKANKAVEEFQSGMNENEMEQVDENDSFLFI
jgi:hypothetical protein